MLNGTVTIRCCRPEAAEPTCAGARVRRQQWSREAGGDANCSVAARRRRSGGAQIEGGDATGRLVPALGTGGSGGRGRRTRRSGDCGLPVPAIAGSIGRWQLRSCRRRRPLRLTSAAYLGGVYIVHASRLVSSPSNAPHPHPIPWLKKLPCPTLLQRSASLRLCGGPRRRPGVGRGGRFRRPSQRRPPAERKAASVKPAWRLS